MPRPLRLPEIDILRLADRGLGLALKLPPGVEIQRDIEFARPGGRSLKLHLLRPRKRSATLPAVVYIFGGGWQGGSPEQGVLAMALLARRGYIGATIEYRLSQEATFPAQLDDCRAAVAFLREHADDLGIDPARIAAVGPSAGGHLAALLGVTAQCEQALHVQAVVDWFGPSDLLAIAYEHGNATSIETMSAKLIGGPLLHNRDKAAAASPLSYLRRGASYPPFLIMHGTQDRLVPPSQSELLHRGLLNAGAKSELHMVEGRGHGWLGLPALRRTASFLDAHLKGAAKQT